MSEISTWLLGMTSGLLGSLIGSLTTIFIVRYSHRYHAERARDQLLRFMRGELARAREALRRWEESIAGQPSWLHEAPRAWDLRSLQDHTIALADVPDRIIELAEEVNRRFARIREAWESGRSVARPFDTRDRLAIGPDELALRRVRDLAEQAGNSCRQAEAEISIALGQARSPITALQADRPRTP